MSTSTAFGYTTHVADELRRMLARQTELPVESLDYAQLMRNMEVLAGSLDLYEQIGQVFALANHGIQKIEVIPGGRAEPDEAGDEPSDAPSEEVGKASDEPTAPETESEKNYAPLPDEDPDPAKTYEMADVRAALVSARRNGTNVTGLLKEFGVENFSAFPVGRYGELMKRLGAE